jgi:leucyl/phenylalanyl-tRNA---protein transferase
MGMMRPDMALHGFPLKLPEDDIVAVGGPLTTERLLAAYRRGIFPWPHDDLPLLWFSPDPRFVIPLDAFRVPESLLRVYRQDRFTFTVDQCFGDVIRQCRHARRPGQEGTWITPAMIRAYTALHQAGGAHSVESWQDGKLVGGLYGVLTDKVFAGESMFTNVSNAGKCALIHLVAWLRSRHVQIIDCQMDTPLLRQFGGRDIPRAAFLEYLG